MLTLHHYLALSTALFLIGLLGVVLRKNLLVAFMSIELMLNAVNVALLACSRFHANAQGQIAAFFIIVLAAAEAALGLGIIVLIFRRRGSVQATELRELRESP